MLNLKCIIESKRSEMIILAQKHGYTAKETVQCSQELDRLINLHQKTSINEDSFNITH